MKLREFKEKVRKNMGEYLIRPICFLTYMVKFKKVAPEDKDIIVTVNEINSWYRGNRYSEITFPGIIKGGDWSSKITPKIKMIRKSSKFHAIVQHFVEKTPWIKTDLFKKRYKTQIDKGSKVKGFSDLQQLEQHYTNTYDKLFESLKMEGVKAASSQNPEIDPIYIIINKDGEVLYTVDGNHRLYMCMVLGIEEIPVRVWMRHLEWQKKRDYILSRKGKNIKPEYQKYLSHPDIVSELGD